MLFPGHDAGDQEGTEDCSRLIHGRVQAKSPSVSNHRSCVGQQHVLGRAAQTLSRTFRDDHQGRRFPTARKCQPRHDQKVQDIAQSCQSPISAGAIRESPGQYAQPGGNHLSEAGNYSDLRRCRSEVL